MYRKLVLTSFSILATVHGQQVGTLMTETHPTLTTQTCTNGGTCTTQNTKIVLDANWRWLHSTENYTNCYTGNTWDEELCPDPTTCASNCALDGADYSGTYGITASGDSLTLKFVTKGSSSDSANVGSRVYLLSTDTEYQEFNLLNNEFTFDVDVSNLPCGLNGALYFTQMDADGGMAKSPANKAGAKYGTGYCDAQCPHDLKFIEGKANVDGWTPSDNDENSGAGSIGTCCTEMDIWEANINDAAYTPHVCRGTGLQACTGTECGDGDNRYGGICDKDGCDFNSYRLGNETFFGPGDIVDSSKPITVVTQFVTADGTNNGALSSINRVYIQNNKVIANSDTNIAGVDPVNSITDSFCNQEKAAFGDNNYFQTLGGMTAFSNALKTPMVLVLSIWDDHEANMLWLDGTYPSDSTSTGALRGPCDAMSGVPATVEQAHPDASVTFSNIKFGPIGSTYNSGGRGSPSRPGTKTGPSHHRSIWDILSRPSTTTSPSSSSTTTSPSSSSTTTSARASTTTSARASTTTSPSHHRSIWDILSRPRTTTSPSSSSTTTSAWASHWTSEIAPKTAQCGGRGWVGPTACEKGTRCKRYNEWYSLCM